MNIADIIVFIVIVLIIGLAVAVIISGKKNGRKCMGCPDSGNCSRKDCCSFDKE